jgi:hypothetical protein
MSNGNAASIGRVCGFVGESEDFHVAETTRDTGPRRTYPGGCGGRAAPTDEGPKVPHIKSERQQFRRMLAVSAAASPTT